MNIIDAWYLRRYRFETAEAMRRHRLLLMKMACFGFVLVAIKSSFD